MRWLHLNRTVPRSTVHAYKILNTNKLSWLLAISSLSFSLSFLFAFHFRKPCRPNTICYVLKSCKNTLGAYTCAALCIHLNAKEEDIYYT